MVIALCIACALCVLFGCSQFFHQRKMKRSAYVMREALRNKDFSFRLSTKGMWSGERAMMDVLNNMGQEMKTLIAENEVESWQKLTRVLTHEIMNATAPIGSISQSLLKRKDVIGTDLEEGIRAIRDTSAGLGHFVENYRRFTLVQKPVPVATNAKKFIDGIVPMYPEVEWEIVIGDDIDIMIDEGLVRQVIINLVKNAREAGATKVGIETIKEEKGICLLISNDGAPIPSEISRDIFTPFFTTKSTGSGIGLSLSRQIMVKQGGELALRKRAIAGWGVTFEIHLLSPHSVFIS